MTKEYIVVEIDMRNDFSNDPRAALPVKGMLEMVGKISTLECHAETVIEVADMHEEDDIEFKDYPPHCIVGTWGSNSVNGLSIIDVEIYKSTIDVWESGKCSTTLKGIGNYLGDDIPIIVVGVATGICVRAFVEGAISRNYTKRLIVIRDCVAGIAPLPEIEALFNKWESDGVRVMTYGKFVMEFIG